MKSKLYSHKYRSIISLFHCHSDLRECAVLSSQALGSVKLQQVECGSRHKHPAFPVQPDSKKTFKGEAIFKYFCFGKCSFVSKENMSLLLLF